MRMRTWSTAPVVIAMITVLTACGGSNDDASADEGATAPAPAPTTAATTTAPPDVTTTSPAETSSPPPGAPTTSPPNLGRVVFNTQWFFKERSPQLIALEGEPAPPLLFNGWLGDADQAAELEAMIGRNGDLSSLEGKIVIVYAWTVHSNPCLKAIKRVNDDVIERFRDEDVVLIPLHLPNADRSQIQAAMSSYGANFPTALDIPGDTVETAGQGKTEATWGMTFFPTFVIIDHRGIVRAAGVLTSQVRHAVDALIEERVRFGEVAPEAS